MNIITKINNNLYKFKDNKKYRKFKNCSIPYPFYDKKRNTFEWVTYSKDDKMFYKKINLLDAFEDNIRYGVIYHYKAKLPIRENNKYHLTTCHCHQFDEVIKALYDYPESFEIPNDYLEEYSKQELEYLKQLKSYLLLIDLKDIRTSKEKLALDKKWDNISKKKRKSIKDKLFLISYSQKWKRYNEKEYFMRYENIKAKEYASYHQMHFQNNKVVNAILSGTKDYLIYVQYSFSSSKLHDKFLLIDSNHKYLGAIEIVSEKIIPFKELKSNMINYQLAGFKNFKEYKDNLLNEFIEESKCFNELFTEDSLIKYTKIKVINKI